MPLNSEVNLMMMINKISLLLFLLSSTLFKTLAADTFFEKADTFLSKYVEDGRVDYHSIKNNPELLNDLNEMIAAMDLENKPRNFIKAFYINAYNLLVIKQVVDKYPIGNPLNVEGFFDGINHKVAGEELTLDQVEKEKNLKVFNDERVHFAVVCAAISCPPLAAFAYFPDNVNEKLEERTRYTLNSDYFIRDRGNNLEISKIFDWYRSDFLREGESIIAYINQYRNDKIAKNRKIDYYEYDWSLNKRED